jgi:hypothetical protein
MDKKGTRKTGMARFRELAFRKKFLVIPACVLAALSEVNIITGGKSRVCVSAV